MKCQFSVIQTACFISVLGLAGCANQSDNVSPELSAQITFSVGDSFAHDIEKRVLNVEARNTLDCPLIAINESIKDVPKTLLSYAENDGLASFQTESVVGTDKPLMLSISLSEIYSSDKTNICYFQSQGFWPTAGSRYEIKLAPSCELSIFERQVNQPEAKLIAVQTVIESCRLGEKDAS